MDSLLRKCKKTFSRRKEDARETNRKIGDDDLEISCYAQNKGEELVEFDETFDNANCFNKLPKELLIKIVQYCEPGDILQCSHVCKDWFDLCCDNRLWKLLFSSSWGATTTSALSSTKQEREWKQIFREWYMMDSLQKTIFDRVNVVSMPDYVSSFKSFTERKITVVGAGEVGKSTLVVQFIQHFFVDEYDPTIEDSYRCMRYVDKKPILYDILDTAGREEYQTMLHFNFTKAHGIVIVFSVTSRPSFEIAKKYYHIILKERQRRFPCILIGTKTDLTRKRMVTEEEGRKLGLELRVPYLELSCTEQDKVEKAFAGLEKIIECFEVVQKGKNKRRLKEQHSQNLFPNSFFILGEPFSPSSSSSNQRPDMDQITEFISSDNYSSTSKTSKSRLSRSNRYSLRRIIFMKKTKNMWLK